MLPSMNGIHCKVVKCQRYGQLVCQSEWHPYNYKELLYNNFTSYSYILIAAGETCQHLHLALVK